MGGLSAQRRAQDAEEVEIGKVVCLPFLVNAVYGEGTGVGGFGGAACQDDGVESAGRDVVDPFCGEGAD